MNENDISYLIFLIMMCGFLHVWKASRNTRHDRLFEEEGLLNFDDSENSS